MMFEIDVTKIDPAEWEALARVILMAAKRAFADPAFMAGFEAWQQEGAHGI